MVGWLVGWFDGGIAGWLVSWLNGGVGWFDSFLFCWLIGLVVCFLFVSLIG